MYTTFWQRLDTIARRMLPVAITLLLALFAGVPFHVPGFGEMAPAVVLISVYYWTIFRPDLLPTASEVNANAVHWLICASVRLSFVIGGSLLRLLRLTRISSALS